MCDSYVHATPEDLPGFATFERNGIYGRFGDIHIRHLNDCQLKTLQLLHKSLLTTGYHSGLLAHIERLLVSCIFVYQLTQHCSVC